MESNKTMAYIFAGISLILFIILVAFAWKGNQIPIMKNLIERQWAEQQKAIEVKHDAEMKAKDAQIAISESKIKALSANYTSLVNKIREKSKQRDAIKPPKDELETQKLFEKLGYKVTVK